MAQKGTEGLLKTIKKVYKSSIAVVFQPRLTTDNSH